MGTLALTKCTNVTSCVATARVPQRVDGQKVRSKGGIGVQNRLMSSKSQITNNCMAPLCHPPVLSMSMAPRPYTYPFAHGPAMQRQGCSCDNLANKGAQGAAYLVILDVPLEGV